MAQWFNDTASCQCYGSCQWCGVSLNPGLRASVCCGNGQKKKKKSVYHVVPHIYNGRPI